MSRRSKDKDSSEGAHNEGSAARTRPLGIEEIIMRREKKSAAEASKVDAGLKEAPESFDDEDTSEHLEAEKKSKSKEFLKDMAKEDHLELEKAHKIRRGLKDMQKEDNLEQEKTYRGTKNLKDMPEEEYLEPERSYKSTKDLKDTPKEDHLEREKYKSTKDLRDMREEEHLELEKFYKSKKDLNDTPEEDHLEQEKSYKSTKDLKDAPKEDHLGREKRHESIKGPKDVPKEGSKKEDKKSNKGDSRSNRKESELRSSEKSSYGRNSRDKETKGGKHNLITKRNGEIAKSESQKEAIKKRKNETASTDRIGRDRKSRKEEGKRKSYELDDRRTEIDRPVLKKQHYGRFQDPNFSERNDRRREQLKPHYEEPRSKRRRSRSQDFDQERHERSVSLSPRTQKRGYYRRDHDGSPPYSKDKYRGKYSEADRDRNSGNGGYGSGSYRKRGSGLGGYSPRKRKTESNAEPNIERAAKAEPPIVQSPEKKTATWDQPPAGLNQPSLVASLQSTAAKMVSSNPLTTTTSKPDLIPSLEAILNGKGPSVDSVQLTQATRPFRRLYVENLPALASEKMVIDGLNDFFLSSGVNHIQGTKPCITCIINKEKCQALVEFLTPEDATAALSFDGRSLSGSVVKIRRPKDYIETASVAPEKPVEEIKIISDTLMDSPHKIFVGGISESISSEMLLEIVATFGPLAAYRFVYSEELGEPCAFLEYLDHSLTPKACAGLNGMKLGGCILTAVQGLPGAPDEDNIESPPFYGVPSHAKPLLADPTKVLQLKNVFGPEEFVLLSKAELDEMLEDIRLECARFGVVKSLNVSRYASSSDGRAATTVSEPEDQLPKNTVVARDACLKQKEDEHDHCDTRVSQNLTQKPENLTTSDDALSKNSEEKNPESLSSGPNTSCEPLLPGSSAHQPVDLDDEGSKEESAISDKDLVDKQTELAEEANLGISAVNEDNTAQGSMSSVIIEGEAEGKCEGDGELMTLGQTGLIQVSADNIKVIDVCKKDSSSDIEVFEPGSVLVEYIREEATCGAAHSLHGRLFGDRVVSAGYVPHDLYLARFPK